MIKNASAVVCHAGVGTIMTTLHEGVMPVVVPRLRRYNEHVDDHQLQIAREFAAQRLVVLHREGRPLASAIDEAGGSPLPGLSNGVRLRKAVARAAQGGNL